MAGKFRKTEILFPICFPKAHASGYWRFESHPVMGNSEHTRLNGCHPVLTRRPNR